MAVTRINGSRRFGEKTVVEALLNDSAVSNRTIANSAVTPEKVDSNGNYTFNKITGKDVAVLKSTLEVDGDLTAKANAIVEQDASIAGQLDVTGNATIGGNVVISGNLQVDGDHVTENVSDLEIEDKNILVNKGGNTDSMNGAGITVDNTDSSGNKGSIVYDANAASKWKVGNEGAEVEVVDLSTTQTLEAKTYKLVGDAIESQDNVEDALRALDNKVNSGTAYKTQEGDTTSSNYSEDSSGNAHWNCGEAIQDNSFVQVYSSGVLLRSGTKDSSGNISNDYSVDYANGVVDYAEKQDGNITVRYIAAS